MSTHLLLLHHLKKKRLWLKLRIQILPLPMPNVRSVPSVNFSQKIRKSLKGLYAENFYLLKRYPLPPWSMCHMWKIWQLPIKNRKMHFCHVMARFSSGKWFWEPNSRPVMPLRAKFSSGKQFWEPNSRPVMPFWEPFSRPVSNFESPNIWQKGSFLFFIAICQNFHLWPLD